MTASHWNRRTVLSGLVASAALPMLSRRAAAANQFAGRQLISSGFGGSTMDIIQQASFAPFEAETGAKTTQVPMQSAAALARMKAEAGSPQIDMYQFSAGSVPAGRVHAACRRG